MFDDTANEANLSLESTENLPQLNTLLNNTGDITQKSSVKLQYSVVDSESQNTVHMKVIMDDQI